MGLRFRPPTESDLAALLRGAQSDELTYGPTGCSLGGPTPPGLDRRTWSTSLDGVDAFARARAAIHDWTVHRGAGLVLEADGPIAIGTNIAFSAPLPIGFVDGTCRIVAVVDTPERFGFAYGTLAVHPERGEESFVVARDESGTIRFNVEGVSRPNQTIARLLPWVANRLQDAAVHRYLEAMTRAVSVE